jgi:hypothetical protein
VQRMPLQRPSIPYDERLSPIDEQICSLLKQRKDLSNDNPGVPSPEFLTQWAESYGMYEEFLYSVFIGMANEKAFRPKVEPSGFRRQLPVGRTIREGERFYTLTTVRQYENASVVQLHIDRDFEEEANVRSPGSIMELSIGETYDCRWTGGGGSGGHQTYRYVVSPPLPDDLEGIEFLFREYRRPHRIEPTGLAIVFRMD